MPDLPQHPISIVRRSTAVKVDKELKLPISPAFINNYRLAREPNVKPIVDFCREKNIPFKP